MFLQLFRSSVNWEHDHVDIHKPPMKWNYTAAWDKVAFVGINSSEFKEKHRNGSLDFT